MIGRVHLGGGQYLVLEDNGTWTCEDPIIHVQMANTLFNLGDWSQSDGEPGFKAIRDAAEFFDGVAEYAYEPQPPPDGAVY